MADRFYRIRFFLLCALVVTLPFNAHRVFWLLSPTDLVIIPFGMVVLVGILSDGELRISRTNLIILFAISVVAVTRILPLLSGASPPNQARYLFTGLIVAIIHLGLSQTVTSRQHLYYLSTLIVGSAFIINLVNIGQGFELFTLPGEFSRFAPTREVGGVQLPTHRRGTALFPAFGTYGIWSIFAAGFAIGALIDRRLASRFVLVSCLSVIVYANVAVLQSRSVWLGFIALFGSVGIATSYLYNRYFQWGIRPLFVAFVVTSPFILTRSARAFIDIRRRTAEVRFLQYRVAIEKALENPLTGVEYNTVREVTGYALHSTVLEVLAYSGVFALLAFVIVYAAIFNRYLRLFYNRSADGVDLGIACGAFGIAVTSLFYPASTSYVFWLSLSIASVNLHLDR